MKKTMTKPKIIKAVLISKHWGVEEVTESDIIVADIVLSDEHPVKYYSTTKGLEGLRFSTDLDKVRFLPN